MIPQEKSEAVTRGLREAFGVTEFEDIRMITGSRLVPRLSHHRARIAISVEDHHAHQRILTRHYTSMKAAAEAGVAPRVWYTNIEDQDFHHRFCGG